MNPALTGILAPRERPERHPLAPSTCEPWPGVAPYGESRLDGLHSIRPRNKDRPAKCEEAGRPGACEGVTRRAIPPARAEKVAASRRERAGAGIVPEARPGAAPDESL